MHNDECWQREVTCIPGTKSIYNDKPTTRIESKYYYFHPVDSPDTFKLPAESARWSFEKISD